MTDPTEGLPPALSRRRFLAFTAAASATSAFGPAAWAQVAPPKPPAKPAAGAAGAAAGSTTQPAKKSPAAILAEHNAEARERTNFFRVGKIPRIKLEIAAEDIEKLRKEPRVYVPAKVTEDGKTVYKEVGVHLRGSAGSFRPIDDPKPGFTLNMDKFTKGQVFHGMDKLHLNNEAQDPSYLSEMLCGELYRAVDVPAARFTHALVMLNDVPKGFYCIKEGYDKGFLREFLKDDDGNFYDGGFLTDVDAELKCKPSKKDVADRADLKALVEAANEPDVAKRFARMSKVLDMPRFVSYMCLQVLTCDWDGYPLGKNNYRVYHHPIQDKFTFVPSGMDQAFDRTDLPLLPTEFKGLVASKLMETPEGRKQYLNRMLDLLRRVFPVARMMSWLDGQTPRLQAALQPLDAKAAADLPNHVRQLRDSVKARAGSIEDQLKKAKA